MRQAQVMEMLVPALGKAHQDRQTVAHLAGSCERMNRLTPRRQGAKTGIEQLLCFPCVLCGFAPWREML
jgi:hypothetical protein